MSVTAIIIVVLVICMAVGPIMMLQPSKRQKRIAGLRTAAAKHGFKVHMARLNDSNIAVYTKSWPADDKKIYSGEPLTLTRKGYAHGLHLSQYWQLNCAKDLSEAARSRLETLLTSLPDKVSGVEITPGGPGLYWLETGGEQQLAEVEAWLRSASETLWPLFSRARLSGPSGP